MFTRVVRFWSLFTVIFVGIRFCIFDWFRRSATPSGIHRLFLARSLHPEEAICEPLVIFAPNTNHYRLRIWIRNGRLRCSVAVGITARVRSTDGGWGGVNPPCPMFLPRGQVSTQGGGYTKIGTPAARSEWGWGVPQGRYPPAR